MTNEQELPKSLQHIVEVVSKGLDEKVKVTKAQHNYLGKLVTGYMFMTEFRQELGEDSLNNLIVKLDSHWDSCFDVEGAEEE